MPSHPLVWAAWLRRLMVARFLLPPVGDYGRESLTVVGWVSGRAWRTAARGRSQRAGHTPTKGEHMRETGILSIVKREPTYQVRYAAFNPYDKDRRPYPRPDEGALVEGAGRPVARRNDGDAQGDVGPAMSGAADQHLSAATARDVHDETDPEPCLGQRVAHRLDGIQGFGATDGLDHLVREPGP